jgi:hypothetical protein
MAQSKARSFTGRSPARPNFLASYSHNQKHGCRRFANSCERGGSAGITSDDFEHEKNDADRKSDNPDRY